MGFNPVFSELLLKWGLNIDAGGAPARPTTFWVAFHTADPTADGSVGEHTDIARTSHAAWELGTADDGEVQNSGAGESAADGGVGATITHFSVWSLVTGGICYFNGTCTNKATSNGDTITWAPGALTAAITNA